MRKTLLTVAVAGALGLAAGCTTTQDSQQRAEWAAYAARQNPPATMPSDMNAGQSTATIGTVLTGPGHNTLRLLNYTGDSLMNFDVWVNGAFVRHVDSLAAHSTLDMDLSQFYDRSGRTITQVGAPVTKVQIAQNGGRTMTLLGPISE